ncbi:MAG: hypothetical protein ACRD9R_15900 [Pyrinomonadaceae bacterium]
MSTKEWSAAVLLSLSFAAPVAWAQESFTPTATDARHATAPKRDDKAAAELERRALALLDEVLEEQSALVLFENRARLGSSAAEVLWARDPARARKAFREAMDEIVAAMRGLDQDPAAADQSLTSIVSQLRQQMLQQIAPHDPKLALEFLRATRQPPPVQHPGNDYKQPDQELALELMLAQQIAASDPREALRLAEETLQKGINSNLIQVLMRVRETDAEAANKFAADILKKLNGADFLRDHEATGVAGFILNSSRPPSATTQGTNGGIEISVGRDASANTLRVDAPARRALLNDLFRAAVGVPEARLFSGGGGYNLFSTLQQLMPELQQQLTPAQMAVWQRRSAGFEQRQNPHGRIYREFEQLNQNGTLERILEAAKQAPPEVRPNFYQNAARRAFSEGGIERAREIIETHIEDKTQRAQMLRDLEQQQLWQAIGQPDVELARQLIARVKQPEERVSMLLNLAGNLANANQASLARQLVEEAWNAVGGRPRNGAQLSAQLQIAQAYAPRDPGRAFEIIEGCVEHLNRLLDAAATLNGFGQEAFQDDELKLHTGYPWNQFVDQLSQELGELGRVDFARARAAADKFQRLDARLLARLGVARAVLLSATPDEAQGGVTLSLPMQGRRKMPVLFIK